MKRIAALLVLMLGVCVPALSATQAQRRLEDAGFDQRLGSHLPLQTAFRDERGKAVQLGDYFKGDRPVVLVFAYYHCPNLCDSVLAAVFDGLAKTGYRGGDDFSLVVVGIDPTESASDAADKKQTELGRYPFPGAREHAHFLTGARPDIQAVAKAAGFRYYYDQNVQQYVHAAGLLVATPEGIVSRYMFGVQFQPSDLRLAMVDASGNKVGSVVDKLLLLCCQYDPTTGQYGFVIMNILRLAGAAAVIALGIFVWLSVRRERRRRPTTDPGVQL